MCFSISVVFRCNFDEETSGYISMETRFKMLLFFIFIIIMVILILIFCCKCCCRKKSSPKNNLHPHQPHNPPQPPPGPRRQKRMNMKQRVLLVVGFVCFAYIVSFFVEGGSNKSHKYRQNGIQMMQVGYQNTYNLSCRHHSIKLELAKYYKDSKMTAFISKRSRNSKQLKKYDPP